MYLPSLLIIEATIKYNGFINLFNEGVLLLHGLQMNLDRSIKSVGSYMYLYVCILNVAYRGRFCSFTLAVSRAQILNYILASTEVGKYMDQIDYVYPQVANHQLFWRVTLSTFLLLSNANDLSVIPRRELAPRISYSDRCVLDLVL